MRYEPSWFLAVQEILIAVLIAVVFLLRRRVSALVELLLAQLLATLCHGCDCAAVLVGRLRCWDVNRPGVLVVGRVDRNVGACCLHSNATARDLLMAAS
jgi:hypothetical protein